MKRDLNQDENEKIDFYLRKHYDDAILYIFAIIRAQRIVIRQFSMYCGAVVLDGLVSFSLSFDFRDLVAVSAFSNRSSMAGVAMTVVPVKLCSSPIVVVSRWS